MSDPTAHGTVIQPSIPEWDQNAVSAAKTEGVRDTTASRNGIPKGSLRDRFDAAVPPHRTYLGLKRKWFLIAVLCVFLALLALIIGLAVGLTAHHHGRYVIEYILLSYWMCGV